MFRSNSVSGIRFEIFFLVVMALLFAPGCDRTTTDSCCGGCSRSTDAGELKLELISKEAYDRPLFGSEPPFVTFGGSSPVFAISGGWYGGKLGNLHMVITTPDGSFAAYDAKDVKSTYDGLSLQYVIRDNRIKNGVLRLGVYPARPRGTLAHLAAQNLPPQTSIAWVYGGASGEYDYKYPSNYRATRRIPILPL